MSQRLVDDVRPNVSTKLMIGSSENPCSLRDWQSKFACSKSQKYSAGHVITSISQSWAVSLFHFSDAMAVGIT